MATGPAGRQVTVTLHAPDRPGFYEVWLLARDGHSMISLGDLGPGHQRTFTMPPGWTWPPTRGWTSRRRRSTAVRCTPGPASCAVRCPCRDQPWIR